MPGLAANGPQLLLRTQGRRGERRRKRKEEETEKEEEEGEEEEEEKKGTVSLAQKLRKPHKQCNAF